MQSRNLPKVTPMEARNFHTVEELSQILVTPLYKITNLLDSERRSNYQKRVRVVTPGAKKVRWTYKSLGSLAGIQAKVDKVLAPLYSEMEYEKHVIGYRTGLHLKDELEKLKGFDCIIQIDIKGYYDYITLTNIKEALVGYGFNQAGAKLLGRLNLVWNGKVNSLQQGSHASPTIANLVGHHVWDKPILNWLNSAEAEGGFKSFAPEDTTAKFRYVRYSDNLLIAFSFADIEKSRAFKEAYIKKVHACCKAHKFIAKPADVVPQNHPHRAQKFLGAIINHQVRIDTEKFQSYRALLFNWVCKPPEVFFQKIVTHNPKSFAILNSTNSMHHIYNRQLVLAALLQEVKGFTNYVGNINKVQYRQLKNLLYALDTFPSDKYSIHVSTTIDTKWFNALKQYKLPIQEYKDICDSLNTEVTFDPIDLIEPSSL